MSEPNSRNVTHVDFAQKRIIPESERQTFEIGEVVRMKSYSINYALSNSDKLELNSADVDTEIPKALVNERWKIIANTKTSENLPLIIVEYARSKQYYQGLQIRAYPKDFTKFN